MSISIERTFDVNTINSIANHPEIIEKVSLQKENRIDLKNKIENKDNIFILVSKDNTPIGNLSFYKIKDSIYEIHACFLPGNTHSIYRACRDAINLVSKNYNCNLLVTKIPRQNGKAFRLFTGLGAMYSRTKIIGGITFDYYMMICEEL